MSECLENIIRNVMNNMIKTSTRLGAVTIFGSSVTTFLLWNNPSRGLESRRG